MLALPSCPDSQMVVLLYNLWIAHVPSQVTELRTLTLFSIFPCIFPYSFVSCEYLLGGSDQNYCFFNFWGRGGGGGGGDNMFYYLIVITSGHSGQLQATPVI